MNKEERELLNNMNSKELDILYRTAKIIAETDSIGEGWHGYCGKYTRQMFEEEIAIDGREYDNYVLEAAFPIYKLWKEEYPIETISPGVLG